MCNVICHMQLEIVGGNFSNKRDGFQMVPVWFPLRSLLDYIIFHTLELTSRMPDTTQDDDSIFRIVSPKVKGSYGSKALAETNPEHVLKAGP